MTYCWRIYFKVLAVLFLGEVSPAFLPSKQACWTCKFRHLGVGQQYPSVFLVGQMSGGFVVVRCEKTRQKINASFPCVSDCVKM
jgi:hypothetical protein